ncbi:MAG: outer membrane protein assembly factor BamA [Candidatus Azobacteroides sp.]|nr:outer membrane protein assembly factor BamA [Candidatus Azobacteroides sp.]
MSKKIILFCISICYGVSLFAQEATDTIVAPAISYSLNHKKFEIADIKVTGAPNYEDFVLIGFSGLSVGDKIEIPGDEITAAVKRFWKHGLFSDVKILATKMTDDKVWIEIALKQRPTISEITISGVKKGEKKDIEERIGIAKGSQVTPNLIDRAKKIVKKYFEEKGFSNIDVQILQRDDLSNPGKIFLDVDINRNEKTKIQAINITGNEVVSDLTLKKAMKKTNEGFNLKREFRLSWLKLFSTKKFVNEEFRNDLNHIIDKYNELGFRDAKIVSDSVERVGERKVNIFINIEEGQKYFIRNIDWVGNTQYSSSQLDYILNMKSGDVYNQRKLNERLSTDDDAVSNIYYNKGFIFFNLDPVETNVVKDSVDLEVRVSEGPQATINKVTIIGNDRLYEDVIRRELRTKPGQLFSRDALMRSLRELAQMGHFDPENMKPDVTPDAETGTVDIAYNLVPKGNDQVEFSAGWGQTGVIGRLSFKFSNFSARNLFNPSSYKGIIPQGDGQTLTVSAQTNARYYQSYSISFLDPWFGGKRPNSFSVSAYFMRQTDMSSRYYGGYDPYSYYGGDYSDYSDYYIYDNSKYFQVLGASVGYGKRLTWPDDYFSIMAELSYQRYMMKDWNYFIVQNGDCNNLSLGLTLQRNSVDNPLYTRSGSMFVASVNFTPPYSLFDNKDYASMPDNSAAKNRWVEYHKWKFSGRMFMPLANPETVKHTPVLMSRIEYGFLGHYNSNKISPFETFYMGGDGMTGYSSMYATETIGLRGYENGSLTPTADTQGYVYSRMALEFRYPFLLEPSSTIYGLAFVEAGNAWHTPSSFNPFELKRSAGVGVRIFLPMIGLLGLDWAYGFDSPAIGAPKSGSQIHFILGQEF